MSCDGDESKRGCDDANVTEAAVRVRAEADDRLVQAHGVSSSAAPTHRARPGIRYSGEDPQV
jgi:hypothetical protein